MVEIFVQPLVGALCLIVFHIQVVMYSPDHCAWQLGLQVVSSRNSSQQKVLRSPWYAHYRPVITYFILPVGCPTVERRVVVRPVIT